MPFTDITELDSIIFNYVADQDLVTVQLLNKEYFNLVNDDRFWLARIRLYYYPLVKVYPSFTAKQIYRAVTSNQMAKLLRFSPRESFIYVSASLGYPEIGSESYWTIAHLTQLAILHDYNKQYFLNKLLVFHRYCLESPNQISLDYQECMISAVKIQDFELLERFFVLHEQMACKRAYYLHELAFLLGMLGFCQYTDIINERGNITEFIRGMIFQKLDNKLIEEIITKYKDTCHGNDLFGEADNDELICFLKDLFDLTFIKPSNPCKKLIECTTLAEVIAVNSTSYRLNLAKIKPSELLKIYKSEFYNIYRIHTDLLYRLGKMSDDILACTLKYVHETKNTFEAMFDAVKRTLFANSICENRYDVVYYMIDTFGLPLDQEMFNEDPIVWLCIKGKSLTKDKLRDDIRKLFEK